VSLRLTATGAHFSVTSTLRLCRRGARVWVRFFAAGSRSGRDSRGACPELQKGDHHFSQGSWMFARECRGGTALRGRASRWNSDKDRLAPCSTSAAAPWTPRLPFIPLPSPRWKLPLPSWRVPLRVPRRAHHQLPGVTCLPHPDAPCLLS